MKQADLRGTNLREVTLIGADLESVNLEDARVTSEQLAQAKSLKGATMPDRTVHE